MCGLAVLLTFCACVARILVFEYLSLTGCVTSPQARNLLLAGDGALSTMCLLLRDSSTCSNPHPQPTLPPCPVCVVLPCRHTAQQDVQRALPAPSAPHRTLAFSLSGCPTRTYTRHRPSLRLVQTHQEIACLSSPRPSTEPGTWGASRQLDPFSAAVMCCLTQTRRSMLNPGPNLQP